MKRSLTTLAAAVLTVLPAAAWAQDGAGASDEAPREAHLEAAELTVKKDTINVITQAEIERKGPITCGRPCGGLWASIWALHPGETSHISRFAGPTAIRSVFISTTSR